MAHQVRSAFSKVFKTPARKLGLQQVYDVSHNIAKQEVHTLPDGTQTKVLVHRCGGGGSVGSWQGTLFAVLVVCHPHMTLLQVSA